MAESLVMSWDDLRVEVGYLMGVCPTREVEDMDVDALATVDSLILQGYRQFCYPPVIPGMSKAHDWSFLVPTDYITTVAGVYRYDLPDDFSVFSGVMVIDSANARYPPLMNVGPGGIMREQSLHPSLSTAPAYYAAVPKKPTGAIEPSYEVWLHPTPDAAYSLKYRYRVNPQKLSMTRPYHYGGAAHSDTLLQSCLEVVERRLNDGQSESAKKAFYERLAASISHDIGQGAEFLGYNGNPRYGRNRRSQVTFQTFYNGQVPEDYVP